MDMESALSLSSAENEQAPSVEVLAVWRYLSRKYISKGGALTAKPSAFNIKRDENKQPKEPSASLFELRGRTDCSRDNAVCMMAFLITLKNFQNIDFLDASGSLKVSDVNEINKDPQDFSLLPTPAQRKGPMIHWDLTYFEDDITDKMRLRKSALAHICKVYVCGQQALERTRMLPAPKKNI